MPRPSMLHLAALLALLCATPAMACDLAYYPPAVFDKPAARTADKPPASPVVTALRMERAGSLPGSCADIATLHITIKGARDAYAYGFELASGEAPAGLLPAKPIAGNKRDGTTQFLLQWVDQPDKQWMFSVNIRAYSKTGVGSKPSPLMGGLKSAGE